MLHNYRSTQFHRTSFKWYKSIQQFQRHGFRKIWPKECLILQVFGTCANPYGANGQITMMLHNNRWRQVHKTLNGVNPSSSFIDMYSASLDPICGKFDKFLAHGQAHMGQMGKSPWQCTTMGLDNSTELQTEKIRQVVTEIRVPQVWQPPAHQPARTVMTIPLQPGGLRGRKLFKR